MTPIHEMKTRTATWAEPNGLIFNGDVQCHGVFFEGDGREVGVVIRDQPEAVAKPLIEAIAVLPMLIAVLRDVAACAHAPCANCRQKIINAADLIGALP